MDFIKKAVTGQTKTGHGGSSTTAGHTTQHKSEPLDKAIDLVQEHIFKQGSQKNESHAEQAKDAKIASGVKSLFKKVTGKDIPGSSHK